MKQIEQFPPQTLLNVLGTVLICIDHFGWSHQYYAASFCQRLDSKHKLSCCREQRVLWHTPHSCIPLASSWSDVLGVCGGLYAGSDQPSLSLTPWRMCFLPTLEQGTTAVGSEGADECGDLLLGRGLSVLQFFPVCAASIAWGGRCTVRMQLMCSRELLSSDVSFQKKGKAWSVLCAEGSSWAGDGPSSLPASPCSV